jgi:hypothetical protein
MCTTRGALDVVGRVDLNHRRQCRQICSLIEAGASMAWRSSGHVFPHRTSALYSGSATRTHTVVVDSVLHRPGRRLIALYIAKLIRGAPGKDSPWVVEARGIFGCQLICWPACWASWKSASCSVRGPSSR